MDSLRKQIRKGGVHRALAGDAGLAGEARRLDLDREMAFAAFVVADVAAVFLTVVNNLQLRWSECFSQTSRYLGRDRPGFLVRHGDYIEGLEGKGRRLGECG